MHDDKVFTIGYAGKTIDELIAAVSGAGADRVIDVRALPLSRKKGFSKTALAAALAEAQVEYVHLRIAGNPFRELKNDPERCLALYAGHLDTHPEVIDAVEEALVGHRAALLCYEADACECHRSVIVERLKARDPRRAACDL